MRLTENSSEGSAVDPSQAPTVENFGSDNPFLLYKNVLSLSLIHARPCPMKSWHLRDTVTRVLLQYVLLISLFPKDMCPKDQGSDIPTQAFSKNCLDIFIAKSGGTRHLQGLTARSGNSF